MNKLVILANNLSADMAHIMSVRIDAWLRSGAGEVLVLPSGFDSSVPVSIEAILFEIDPIGNIKDAIRLGVPFD